MKVGFEGFTIRKDGRQVGPITGEQLKKRLFGRELSWADELYDIQTESWIAVVEHPYFKKEFLKYFVPQAQDLRLVRPPDSPSIHEWFLLREDKKFGPFSYLEIVRMLQERKVLSFDYVWNSQFSAWKALGDLSEYSPAVIRTLKRTSENGINQMFFQRRHRRMSYEASLVVHNNKTVWRGRSIEISAGGAGIMIDNPDFEPGQTLFFHFKAGEGVPAFNAICAIVSKQFPQAGLREVRYGVQFKTIMKSVQDAIDDYSNQKAA